MNPHHRTKVYADDNLWHCSCGISEVAFTQTDAAIAALRHEAVACDQCPQPFGVCLPDCTSEKPGVQFFRVTAEPVVKPGDLVVYDFIEPPTRWQRIKQHLTRRRP